VRGDSSRAAFKLKRTGCYGHWTITLKEGFIEGPELCNGREQSGNQQDPCGETHHHIVRCLVMSSEIIRQA
jgi:hypothetical protein